METPETAQFPITYYMYVFIALVAVGICILTGVIICCVFKLILRWKKGSLRESNVNREYYEVIDPIYAAVSTITVVDSNHSEAQIKVENNDAYESMKLNERSSRASLGIDIENSINVLQMEHNKSYQVAPFNVNNSVIPEGLTTTYTQECYEIQSVCNDENAQQATSGQAKVHTSQNDEQIKYQNQGEFIPLCTIEGVNVDSSAGSFSSNKHVYSNMQLGDNKLELNCEKQSTNSKEIKSHTVK